MSIQSLLDRGSCPPDWLRVRVNRLHSCTDIQFDGSLIGHIDLNNLPHGASGTFLKTVGAIIQWVSFTKNDIPGGNNGDYLQTIAGQVEWAPPTFGPSTITPGLANQVFVTDPTGTFAEWLSSLNLPGNMTAQNVNALANLVVSGTSNLVGNVTFGNSALVTGDVLAGGNLGITKLSAFGGNATFSSNITVTGSSDLKDNVHCEQDLGVDGDFSVTGLSTLTGPVNVVDDLQMNGISGVTDTVLQKTSAATQSWVLPSQVRCIRYATYFLAQDLNSGVGPTPVTFDNGGGITNISRTSRGVAPGINQTSTTNFTVGFTGLYDIDICGFIDPTSTGLVSTVVSLSLEIATVESTQSCVVVNTFAFTGKFSSIPLLAGQVVRILARRIANTGTMNTIASGGLAPNFSSTIDFTLVSIV